MSKRQNLPNTQIHETIKLASLDDIERIMQLRNNITEFRLLMNQKKCYGKLLKQIQDVHIILKNTAQSSHPPQLPLKIHYLLWLLGMYDPNYRGNGYASLILQKMIQDFTKEGRTLCSFNNNPAAGRIYKRLGFKDIGMWTMYL